MTRRFKRLKDFDLSIEIKNPDFISPPREAQRNWLLNRALNELAMDLNAIDDIARRFVAGSEPVALEDRSQKRLEDHEIMEDWQRPLMEAMAEVACETGGDVLEIGFGRGIAATCIQELGVRSHTIIECNEAVAARFEKWRLQYSDQELRLVRGMWQDTIDTLGLFDAVFFHTYPLNEEEYMDYVVGSTTFAEHFFPAASGCLKPGGLFTYMTNEMDSLSCGHQRALLRHFSSLSLSLRVLALELPSDLRDAWWADSMAIIKAVK